MLRFRHIALLLFAFLLLAAGCDAGLQPPEDVGSGTITGTIIYAGSWPPSEELEDLRFIAMRFTPQDTTDFFRLNEMVISERLPDNVDRHDFVLTAVPTGQYLYSGVAQKYGADLLDWRPVGLVESDGGTFFLPRGGTVHVEVRVDFADPPVFPPQASSSP